MRATGHARASIPFSYVFDPQQRISLYRKLAESTTSEDVQQIHAEMRDRFGPLPTSVEVLLDITRLRILAAGKGVTVVETKEDKLILTRDQEFITFGGRFPRLGKRTASGKLKEIQAMLNAL